MSDRTPPDGPILFLVPARGGSRRVAGKNLRTVGGIPLVGWAVRNARAAAAALGGATAGHRVVCSTDDEAIAAVAAAWGGEVVRRPGILATDTATSVDVALHALDVVDAEATRRGDTAARTLVLLQPTSPLVDPGSVVRAVERHRAAGGAGVTSVVTTHPAPWHHSMDADWALRPSTTLAGADRILAGAFYVIEVGDLRARRRFVDPGVTLGVEIPADRAADVDEEHDLVVAEAILAARPVRPVHIGPLTVGAGRVVVIAEAGVNHNGDVDVAMKLIDAAAAAGADIVEFQTFDPAADQPSMLARLALPADAWPRLAAHAAARGLVFLSTPFDDGSAEFLDRLGVPAFELGSGELTNTPFIARVAARGRPMLVSTGMADMVEVAAAVDAIHEAGDPPLALLHCVSSYPANPEDANLVAMDTMRRAFGVPVGWSDHTTGAEIALAAVAMGASLIEKSISFEPDAFAAMVAGIRTVEAALGAATAIENRDLEPGA